MFARIWSHKGLSAATDTDKKDKKKKTRNTDISRERRLLGTHVHLYVNMYECSSNDYMCLCVDISSNVIKIDKVFWLLCRR